MLWTRSFRREEKRWYEKLKETVQSFWPSQFIPTQFYKIITSFITSTDNSGQSSSQEKPYLHTYNCPRLTELSIEILGTTVLLKSCLFLRRIYLSCKFMLKLLFIAAMCVDLSSSRGRRGTVRKTSARKIGVMDYSTTRWSCTSLEFHSSSDPARKKKKILAAWLKWADQHSWYYSAWKRIFAHTNSWWWDIGNKDERCVLQKNCWATLVANSNTALSYECWNPLTQMVLLKLAQKYWQSKHSSL